MRSYTLSKRDSEAVIEQLAASWPPSIYVGGVKSIRIVEVDDRRSLLLAESLIAAKIDGVIVPFLLSESILPAFPTLVVDAGAVPHLTNGADIMRPGIVLFEKDFQADSIVVAQEERHHKFIASGQALVSRSHAEAMAKGAVVRNLHYVGDKLWAAFKQIKTP